MKSIEELYAIDKNIPVPLYYQLKKQILNRIEDESLQVGDMLPPENLLCEQLGVSRPTVRQALGELVTDGFLTRQKGKGTFVSKPKIDARFFQKLQSFNAEMQQKGLIPSTEVLGLRRVFDCPEASEKLNLPLSAPLIHLKRLRKADNEPIVVLDTYLPYQLFEGLMGEDFIHNSLYPVLERRYNTVVERVHRQIEAVNATEKDAELLHIAVGAAVCLVKTTAFTIAGRPVEYSIARYRGDRNQFSIELYRE